MMSPSLSGLLLTAAWFGIAAVAHSPEENFLILPRLDTLSTTSTTNAALFELTLPTIGVQNKIAAETVHTEQSADALVLPTSASESTTTTTSGYQVSTTTESSTLITSHARAIYQPDVPHLESSDSDVLAPAPQTTTTSANQITYNIVLPTTTNNSPTIDSAPTTQAYILTGLATPTAYIAHTETSATDLQVPTYVAPAYTGNSAQTQAYDHAQPTSQVVYTSNNAVYSVPVQATTTGSPAAVWQSASGAVGLVAGSTGVVVAGTTYSLAAGGSVLYVNGVSTSIKSADSAAWSTSHVAGHSSAYGAGVTSSVSAGPLKSTSTRSVPTTIVTSSVAVSAIKVPTSSTASNAATATGAAAISAVQYGSMSLGIAMSMLGLLLL